MKQKKLPVHLGIIMDGNRRWARKHNLPVFQGHLKGYRVFRKVGDWCLKRGIKILTVYAFSTENWGRSKKEINFLIKLFKRALKENMKNLAEKEVALKVIGRRNNLPKELLRLIEKAEEATRRGKRGILNVALDYGGRQEIIQAIKQIIQKKIPAGRINEKVVSENLYTAGQEDPDFIIRTSGEKRLSGFLTWQSVYSELYFSPKYWPDFTEGDLDEALAEYARRQRRFGKGGE